MADTDTDTELLNAEEVSRSINGFEQIAIRQMFRERLDSLADDATMFMRALLFVVRKREGMNDSDAFKNVMLMPLEDVTESFTKEEEQSENAEAVAERDQAYANFVVGTGLSFTVDQYMNLTLGQREAIIAEANKRG